MPIKCSVFTRMMQVPQRLAPLRRIVAPDSPMPEVSSMPRCHRGQLRVAIGDALEFKQLGAAPRQHELAMGVGIIFLGWWVALNLALNLHPKGIRVSCLCPGVASCKPEQGTLF